MSRFIGVIHIKSYINVELPFYTPKTSIILYVNHNFKKFQCLIYQIIKIISHHGENKQNPWDTLGGVDDQQRHVHMSSLISGKKIKIQSVVLRY